MKRTLIQPTPFGPVAVLWSIVRKRAKVGRVILSRPDASASDIVSSLFPDAETATCPGIDDLCSGITALLEGESVRFPLSLARLDQCPPFQQSVLRAEHAIPRGKVSSYSLIATHLGKPKAARAVGAALATNPFPLIIPCHRAIRTDGTLGGYQGGVEMKRSLLEYEGVEFDDKGFVGTDPMW